MSHWVSGHALREGTHDRVGPAWVSVTMTLEYSSCHGRAITAWLGVNSVFDHITPTTREPASWPPTYPAGEFLVRQYWCFRGQKSVHHAEEIVRVNLINCIIATCPEATRLASVLEMFVALLDDCFPIQCLATGATNILGRDTNYNTRCVNRNSAGLTRGCVYPLGMGVLGPAAQNE